MKNMHIFAAVVVIQRIWKVGRYLDPSLQMDEGGRWLVCIHCTQQSSD